MKKKQTGRRMLLVTITACIFCLAGACAKDSAGRKENENGLALYGQGQYEAAAEAFGKAAAADAACAEYLANEAMAEMELGQAEKAQSTLDKALALDPKNADALRCAGIFAVRAGDTQKAADYFEQAADAASGKPQEFKKDCLLYLADAQCTLGLYENALETYNKIPKKERTDEVSNAIENVQNAISGSSAALFVQQARTKMEEEAYEEALSLIEEGLKMESASTQQLQYLEAVCYEYLGEYDTALTKFTQYRDSYGSDEKIDREILFLESRKTEAENPDGAVDDASE